MSAPTITPTRPASAEQVKYIKNLLEKHDITHQLHTRITGMIEGTDPKRVLTGGSDGTASQIITWLKTQPVRDDYVSPFKVVASTTVKVTPPAPVTRPTPTIDRNKKLPVGLYIQERPGQDDKVWRITSRKVRNRDYVVTRVFTLDAYGNAVQSSIRDYQVAALPGLRPATDAEVHRLTLKFKRCAICGKKLRVEESVQRGIGPVCNAAQHAARNYRGY